MKTNFKPIFIVSNWKAGSTLLQFMLAQDPKIYNFFPQNCKDKTDYDGTSYWNDRIKPDSINRRSGNQYPLDRFHLLDKDGMISELNDMFDDKCEYGLFKRPQFIVNIELVKYLFPDAKIIAIQRDPIATAFSYYRSNQSYILNYPGFWIGLKPPGWLEHINDTLFEYIAWCERCSRDQIKLHNIPTVKYEDLCDRTDETIDQLSKILDIDLEIEERDITNLNNTYKHGSRKRSRNLETTTGKIKLEPETRVEVPPFNDYQIKDLKRWYKEYDIDV